MIPLLNKIILLITKVHKGSFKSLGLLILIVLNTFIEALGIVVILFFLKILINEKILNDYLQAINNYLSSHQYFILNEYSTKKEFIIILIFFIILIYTLRFLFSLFYIIKLSNYNSYLEEIFSNKLYKNFINKDYEHIFYINSNDFLRNLIANTNALTAVINFYFYLLSEIIIFIILLILLFYLQSFYLSVIFIFIFSSMSLIIYFRNKEIKKIGEIYNSSMSNKVRIITETFQGIREIIIYKYNNYLYDYFTLINKNKSDPTKKLFIANSIIRPLIEYFFILFILITAILAFYINKKDIIDISSLIAFFLISIRLLPCISRILTNSQNINYRRAAVNSIIDELNISFNISNILKKKESKLFFEFKKK